MLRIVAENLAENAIRYAGHGATLTLSVAAEDGRAVLTAADDGIGVAAADLPRLFERFWRADAARASRGTGPRARDREARRHGGRRHGRGARRPRPRAEVRCVF